ncbi:hypothetical protein KI387_034818, partial [Taxus chinensis]
MSTRKADLNSEILSIGGNLSFVKSNGDTKFFMISTSMGKHNLALGDLSRNESANSKLTDLYITAVHLKPKNEFASQKMSPMKASCHYKSRENDFKINDTLLKENCKKKSDFKSEILRPREFMGSMYKSCRGKAHDIIPSYLTPSTDEFFVFRLMDSWHRVVVCCIIDLGMAATSSWKEKYSSKWDSIAIFWGSPYIRMKTYEYIFEWIAMKLSKTHSLDDSQYHDKNVVFWSQGKALVLSWEYNSNRATPKKRVQRHGGSEECADHNIKGCRIVLEIGITSKGGCEEWGITQQGGSFYVYAC